MMYNQCSYSGSFGITYTLKALVHVQFALLKQFYQSFEVLVTIHEASTLAWIWTFIQPYHTHIQHINTTLANGVLYLQIFRSSRHRKIELGKPRKLNLLHNRPTRAHSNRWVTLLYLTLLTGKKQWITCAIAPKRFFFSEVIPSLINSFSNTCTAYFSQEDNRLTVENFT